MRKRTNFILTILALIVLALITYMPSRRPSHATALPAPTAAKPMTGNVSPGPTQFYAQHNLVSDGAIPADHTDILEGSAVTYSSATSVMGAFMSLTPRNSLRLVNSRRSGCSILPPDGRFRSMGFGPYSSVTARAQPAQTG